MSALALEVTEDPVAFFRRTIESVIRLRRGALKVAGGNFVVHVPDHSTFTVVTQGAEVGVFDGVLEAGVRFAMLCTPEVVQALIDGDQQEVQAAVEDGRFGFEGDFQVFERFLGLLGGRSALSVRAGAI